MQSFLMTVILMQSFSMTVILMQGNSKQTTRCLVCLPSRVAADGVRKETTCMRRLNDGFASTVGGTTPVDSHEVVNGPACNGGFDHFALSQEARQDFGVGRP